MRFSVQCFCGDTLINGATLGSESDCNMGCGGNTTYVILFGSTSSAIYLIA